MSANRGGQSFAGSLGLAGVGAFYLPTPYQWAAIAWLALVGSVLGVANWTCLAMLARRGTAPSMFPLLGNSALLLAGLAVPTHSFRGWAMVGFLADPWLLATLLGLADFRVRGHGNRDSKHTGLRKEE